MTHLHDALDILKAITNGCRPDMHEPDEQGLRAFVIGDHLDNAMGHRIDYSATKGGYQEYVVVFRRGPASVPINLATLIALARLARIPEETK